MPVFIVAAHEKGKQESYPATVHVLLAAFAGKRARAPHLRLPL
jgi:hypothetical protein